MAAQEERHLERFDRLMAERRVRPTALQPLWNIAGYRARRCNRADVGGSRACLHRCGGDRNRPALWPSARASSATTTPSLPRDIAEFRAEEVEHRDTAREAGALNAAGYPLLTAAIRAGCKIAIELSKRI